jgi:GT2 family glycosyltransferase
MNYVLILTKNNLHLTQKCVESVRAQDCGEISIHVHDNDSTDETPRWLSQQLDITDHSSGVDLGVSAAWNFVLETLFSKWQADHVLVVNNDTYLPSWFYKTLLMAPFPFVTGVTVRTMDEIAEIPKSLSFSNGPDFSAFLIHREAWEKIGPFDEDMVLYAQDLDYHVRGSRLGVQMVNSGLPFYHKGSQTLQQAHPYTRLLIQKRADQDRDAFLAKYGVNLQVGESYSHLLSVS